MNAFDERIDELRKYLKRDNISAYIVCTGDYHGSEYAGDYFKERDYLSGFTGSAGTLLVTQNDAFLWTDGRYFIQAQYQLNGSSIVLMRSGENDVPSVGEYLGRVIEDNSIIAFDGRSVTCEFVNNIKKCLNNPDIKFKYDTNYVDYVWKDRPALPNGKVWMLDEKYAGEKTLSKISRVRKIMEDNGAQCFALTSLDDIAWLLNLRGSDIDFCPMFLSYMMIGMDYIKLYIDREKLDAKVSDSLRINNIEIHEYDSIYSDLRNISDLLTIMLDEKKVNYSIAMIANDNKNITVKNCTNPTSLLKSIKNSVEIANERKAHIKDGVAVTHFIYWLKNNVSKTRISEIGAANKIDEFRREQKNYLYQSFAPIMAYGKNAAIVHYSADENSDTILESKGFLLSDTGGHYLEGTTDITRTISLGELTEKEKSIYTTVLKGHLRLANTVFKEGSKGANIDIVAREPLWKEGLDYNHGTGHGVGYLLNVHEAPNAIRYKIQNASSDDEIFREGMITSDEPGYYEENSFGIRHESLILCCEKSRTEYGKFLGFEYLTAVPFDREAIVVDMLDCTERKFLNEYHRFVFESISEYFDGEELKWLEEVTSPI